jgi:hypothetical protein
MNDPCLIINPNILCFGTAFLCFVLVSTLTFRTVPKVIKALVVVIYPLWIIFFIYLIRIGQYIPQNGQIPATCTSVIYLFGN